MLWERIDLGRVGVDAGYAKSKGTATEMMETDARLMLFSSANGLRVLGLIRSYPLQLTWRLPAVGPLEL